MENENLTCKYSQSDGLQVAKPNIKTSAEDLLITSVANLNCQFSQLGLQDRFVFRVVFFFSVATTAATAAAATSATAASTAANSLFLRFLVIGLIVAG